MKKVITFILLILTCWLHSPEWSPSASPAPKRVAILGFKNLTGEPELDYLGSGFGETLTTKLNKVQELTLIERMQIIELLKERKFQISGFVDENTAVKAGKILGVEYVIIGSFQKVANRIKADTRLVSVETGKIEAADDVKGNYNDLFELQEELALKLAKSLNVSITAEEKIEIAKKPAKTLSAYEWYSRGVHYYGKFKYNDTIRCLRKAVEVDEDYAYALHYLGLAYGKRSRWSEAIIVYKKAMSIYLDENNEKGLAGVYNNIGMIYRRKGNYDKAMEYYKKSIPISEKVGYMVNLGHIYTNIGNIYCDKGDYDKAMEYYKKSLKIKERIGDESDTAHTIYVMSWVYEAKGDYDKAIEVVEEAIKIFEKTGYYLLKGAKKRLQYLKKKR